jgi:hypothetical protein
MTMSEFETLRADLAAFRSEVTTEFATLRVMVNAKPDTSTIYQAVLAIVAAMFAMVVGTAVLLKTIGPMA